MKSFVAYPLDFEKILFPDVSESSCSGKLLAHYELYKKVGHLEGSVVKCGVTAKEGLTRLLLFRNLIASTKQQKVIAFEKVTKMLYLENNREENAMLQYKTIRSQADLANIEETLKQEGITEHINYIAGTIGDAIPEYLIENPDLKISYLNIDFDDYDATLTTLQFFYPRLVHDGILIIDNYYKKEEDFRAINDFFKYTNVTIHDFSVNKGPHYLVRN